MSPFSPFGPTIALLFVLLVAAVKAAIEDKKRHREDRITNNSIAHVVNPDGIPPFTRSQQGISYAAQQVNIPATRVGFRDAVKKFLPACFRVGC